MGIELQYFFNSPLPLPELAAVLDHELGCAFKPYQSDEPAYSTTLLGMGVSLGRHDFENDCELDFESFQYYLDLQTSAGMGDRRPVQLPLLLAITHVIHRRLGYPGILVYDLQILLARYEQRGSGPDHTMVDTLSGTSPRDYENHLHTLWNRCPPGFGRPHAEQPHPAETNPTPHRR
ncbi:hypothetical protein GCM10010492_50450 [Saccharothrix mutabilis subsp. mutabilis]|uniref:Uncharacterized protein n=1 Tax=Saccharothrix mutabilis subsp. mutabilis TaxID=66855 RepID=A0ABP3DZK4_9PSEU